MSGELFRRSYTADRNNSWLDMPEKYDKNKIGFYRDPSFYHDCTLRSSNGFHRDVIPYDDESRRRSSNGFHHDVISYDDESRRRSSNGFHHDVISYDDESRRRSASPFDRKLHHLERHLMSLHEDNHQMSERIAEAEDLIRDLDSDKRFDGSPVPGFEKQNKQFKKLKRELKQLRFEFDRLLEEQNKTKEEEEEKEHVTGGGKRPCRYCKRHHHHHQQQQQQQQHQHHSRHRISGIDDCCCACFDQSEPEDTDLDYIHRDSSPRHRRLSSSSLRRSLSAERDLPENHGYVGFRSVLPRPASTQHNRHKNCFLPGNHVSPSNSKYKRSFVPTSVADLNLGDRVQFRRNAEGQSSTGVIKYLGHLPGKTGAFLGVELQNEIGKHNGELNGYRYFQCKANRGLFVPFSQIIQAWTNTY